MASRSALGRFFASVAWWVVNGPRVLLRWLREHLSYVVATLWLAGMASFVGLTAWKALAIQREAERARLEAIRRKEEARIAAEVEAALEKRPLPKPDGGADGGATLLAANGKGGAATPQGGGGPGQPEAIELMDFDEMERARGGSDEAAREAIKGLQEEYEGEDGGASDSDGGVAEMETMVIRGGNGEDVTIKMKKGGFSGWIQRNKKYRKRKLGDAETLQVMAEVTGGIGTKVKVNPNSPLGGLAAIAAIRGSAVAEAEETGAHKDDLTNTGEDADPGVEHKPGTEGAHGGSGKASPGAVAGRAGQGDDAPGGGAGSGSHVVTLADGGTKVVAGGGGARHAVTLPDGGTAVVAGGDSTPRPSRALHFGGLELEILGLAASVAITSPVEADEAAAAPAPVDKNKEALAALAKSFEPLATSKKVELVTEHDRVVVKVPNASLFRSGRKLVWRSSGRDLVKKLAGVLKDAPCAIQSAAADGASDTKTTSSLPADKRIEAFNEALGDAGIDAARLKPATVSYDKDPPPPDVVELWLSPKP